MTQYSGKIIRKTPVVPTQQVASGVWTVTDAAAATRNNAWPVAGVPDPISRSVRLRNSASAYLNRTPAVAGNRQIYTFSTWIKRGSLSVSNQSVFGAGSSDTAYEMCRFNSDNTLEFHEYVGSYNFRFTTTQVFRDPSAWYHIVIAVDTTQATSTNRVKIYVNGVQVTAFATATYPSLNLNSQVNAAVQHRLGYANGGQAYLDGYLTETNLIDGQALTPASFGTTDALTGAWVPMAYTGTYGTNGFYLNFKDNTSTTTLGYDYSGNANNWTANNISLTAGVTYDSMLDVPTPWVGYNTDGGASVTRGNYCTFNPLNASLAPTNGNLNIEPSGTSGNYIAASTTGVSTGKWYYEVVATTYTGSGQAGEFGFRLASSSAATVGTSVGDASGFAFGMALATTWYSQKYGTTAVQLTGLSNATTGTIGMIAVDFDTGYAWVGKDGTWYNSGNPATGANPTITGITAGTYVATIAAYRDATRNYSYAANFGQRPFSYTPPTGFKALCTTNLPEPTIKLGAQYMAATTYTGNSSTNVITNGGNNTTATTFQPDLVWVKSRSVGRSHRLQDSIRGVGNTIYSNETAAEGNDTSSLTAFNSNGFSLGTNINYNNSAELYIGWQWKAAGSSVSNTNGTITSTVNAGTTQGFSVVTYTGTGASATVGHGLGVRPAMMIVKLRSGVDNWTVYHQSMGATKGIQLNQTAASQTLPGYWNDTAPTSSVFSVGSYSTANGSTYVAYCFAEVAGYSAFGSYTGNGSTDGAFVYCGFRPRFVLIRNISIVGVWVVLDTSRSTFNQVQDYLLTNSSQAEVNNSTVSLDVTANGFKIRGNDSSMNGSGNTIIFAAFAENPFKYSNAR